ncbi:unnamed protein product [Calicophoron daubneyi]|uniref:G-protein coupled receptors family 1 profile domain-containing protein n=1 Tax=Calicophoron daubneyi TaxID=300641 RepID=A0AAV2TAK8_CALDB
MGDSRSAGILAIEILVCSTGVLLNLFILGFLHFHRIGSLLTTRLFKIQCIFDSVASLLALIYLMSNEVPSSFSITTRTFFCHEWKSGLLLWFTVFLSRNNLLCIAFDYVRAVLRPARYKRKSHTAIVFYCIFTISYSFVLCVPIHFDVHFNQTTCIHKLEHIEIYEFKVCALFSIYFWTVFGYLLTVLIVVILLTNAIREIRRLGRRRNRLSNLSLDSKTTGDVKNLSSNNAYRTASQITIRAAFLGLLFIITHLYHVIYFFLCAYGVVKFSVTSKANRLATLLDVTNSTFNPAVMMLFNPSLQRKITSFLLPFKRGRPSSTPPNFLSH